MILACWYLKRMMMVIILKKCKMYSNGPEKHDDGYNFEEVQNVLK